MPITLGILAQARQAVATGAFQLLESTVLTGTQASVEFTNLATKYAATYQHLQIRAIAKANTTNAERVLFMQFNSDSTASNYRAHLLQGFNGGVFSDAVPTLTRMIGYIAGADGTNTFGGIVIDILDPFETTKNKTSRALSGNVNGTGVNAIINLQSHLWMNTNAVTSITLLPSAGSLVQFSRFSLYGVKATA
jgi:hypothetical protein